MIRVWKTKDTCHKPYCDLEQLNCHLEGSTSYGHYFLICLIPTRVVLFSCAGFILITLLHSNFQFVPKTNTHVTKRDTYIITQNAQRCIFIEKRKWKYDVIERFTTQVFFYHVWILSRTRGFTKQIGHEQPNNISHAWRKWYQGDIVIVSTSSWKHTLELS